MRPAPLKAFLKASCIGILTVPLLELLVYLVHGVLLHDPMGGASATVAPLVIVSSCFLLAARAALHHLSGRPRSRAWLLVGLWYSAGFVLGSVGIPAH
jgi:hypothetical protein